MKTVGNVIWLIFGGLISCILAYLIGIILCVTILFIPVGLQFFKVGSFVLWPMGKHVVSVSPTGFKTVINVIWAIIGGWECALYYLFLGLFYCITIIGIPFGLQCFKMAQFVLLPLGKDFVAD